MTSPQTDTPKDPVPPPNYDGILERALGGQSFAQLVIACYKVVNALYLSPDTPKEVIAWVMENGGSDTAIRSTLSKFLCFIVADDDLLAFNGDLSQATLEQLETVITKRVQAFVAASARAAA